MRSFPYKVTFLFFFCFLLFGAFITPKNSESNLNAKQQETSHPSAEENYTKLCASCHGINQETFINREWHFGNEKPNLIHSITYGQLDLGMVPFESVLSTEEINDLAGFILKVAKTGKTDFIAQKGPEINVSEKVKFRVDTIVSGLNVPWGLAFLPNGDLLITEKSGKLYHYSKGILSDTISGLPTLISFGQGGLMDIAVHPNYKDNGWIYMTYSKPETAGKRMANTAVCRAKLKGNTLVNVEELFVAHPFSKKGQHWGSKLAFDGKGHVFFGVGDRGARDVNPQSLTNDCGKIHRINEDGTIPADNPFVHTKGARPSIYSYGHRNPQGTVIHPITGEIWESEHGPKGGDEINLIKPGLNYGWPIISFGINYNGTTFTDISEKEGMQQPIHYYDPSIAPCGMTFVDSKRYKGWENNILLGSLSFRYLERVELDGNKVVHTEKLLENIGRVRNVKVSPDGYIYVAIEKPGKILKLYPIH